MGENAPPQEEVRPGGGEHGQSRSTSWSAPVILGVGGIVAFWATFIVALVRTDSVEPSHPVCAVIGGVMAIAVVGHLIGVGIALSQRRGNWITGLIVNAAPLAVLAAMIAVGWSLTH